MSRKRKLYRLRRQASRAAVTVIVLIPGGVRGEKRTRQESFNNY